MTSAARIAANRANAAKSTGPRTHSGKAASRRNALKHGMTARALLPFDESLEDFTAFHDGLRHDYAPEARAEEEIVERIVIDRAALAAARIEIAKRTQCPDPPRRSQAAAGAPPPG